MPIKTAKSTPLNANSMPNIAFVGTLFSKFHNKGSKFNEKYKGCSKTFHQVDLTYPTLETALPPRNIIYLNS